MMITVRINKKCNVGARRVESFGDSQQAKDADFPKEFITGKNTSSPHE
jgi:hypothetical protein